MRPAQEDLRFPVLANDVARFAGTNNDSGLRPTERASANQSDSSTVAYPPGVNPSPPVKNTRRNLPMSISSPLVSTAEPIGSPLT